MIDSMSYNFRGMDDNVDFFSFEEVQEINVEQSADEAIDSYLNEFAPNKEQSHEHVMCIKCCAVYEVESINAAYNAAGLDPKTFKCNCGCSQVLPMGRS
ncbi:hypothetical protein DC915_RS02695 [Vibrio parahaemolyticus]|uniref:Uncharacterized protein n=1 Tax=Vibrio jasicida TaxID=766224 RepID=A0AAU9QTC3_9VIBR|nr:hypothetical protein [Vibrio parahaemolyticus]EJG0009886.1 hypothetical protein [Vibrio parahaemolyticus]CAH1598838.1 hypothetical protein THF1C08_50263 [Vibrio jasicida]CAH1601522.1 hypothetical protein THF1A12_50084 [Vibrio jasicida]